MYGVPGMNVWPSWVKNWASLNCELGKPQNTRIASVGMANDKVAADMLRSQLPRKLGRLAAGDGDDSQMGVGGRHRGPSRRVAHHDTLHRPEPAVGVGHGGIGTRADHEPSRL